MYDLLVDGRLADQAYVTGGNTLTIDMTTGTAQNQPGPPGTLRFTGLPDRVKDVEICSISHGSDPQAPTSDSMSGVSTMAHDPGAPPHLASPALLRLVRLRTRRRPARRVRRRCAAPSRASRCWSGVLVFIDEVGRFDHLIPIGTPDKAAREPGSLPVVPWSHAARARAELPDNGHSGLYPDAVRGGSPARQRRAL
ncbi:hypothetical protein ACWCXB_26620 [Streptomyces sp. NPDC001514]